MNVFGLLHRRGKRDGLVALTLAIIAALVWCWFYHRLDATHWKQPPSVGGDALLIMSGAQAAAEGDFAPWQFKNPHRLGAPFGSSWNSWPITEEFLFWTIGVVSRLTGLPAALSLAMLTAHALAAASFYLASRSLGKRRLPSAVFALLFGLSYFIFLRGLGHLTVGYCWHIPLCWAVVCYGSSVRGMFKNRRRAAWALGVAVLTGLQNPYYTFLFAQFLGLAALAQAVRRRPWRVVLGPVAVAGVALAVFASMQLDTLLDRVVHHRGGISAQRSYADMERYALKPLDLLLPLHWRVPFLERVTETYGQQKLITAEYPLAFLGVVAVAGALLLMGLAFRDLTLRGGRLSPPVRHYGVPAVWIVAVSMVGGVLGMGALLTGVYFLRGADRFSIAIVALLMFFLVDAFTAATRRWPPWSRWLLAILPLAAGGWELHALRWPEGVATGFGKQWDGYGAFVERIEQSTGRDAMLFNLPNVDFPEIPPKFQEDTYAPLELYVARPSSLRFSFGNPRDDYRDAWQKTCAHLPPAAMVAELRHDGFAGVVVSCLAYPDHAQGLLTALCAVTGTAAIHSPAADLAFVPLSPAGGQPSAPAPLPPSANLSLESGWWPPEETADGSLLLWTRGDATAALYRDPALPAQTPAVVSFTVAASTARVLSLSCRGQLLARVALSSNETVPLESLRVPVQPGWNRLNLRTDQPPGRRADSPTDPRTVALLVTGLKASGLARGDTGPPVGVPLPAGGHLDPARRSLLAQAPLLEATDAAGRWWKEFHAADRATLQGSAGQPVRRIEFLPNGQGFCVVAEVTPGPAQVDHATLLSCLKTDFHGFTLERRAGAEPIYDAALGDGSDFQPLGSSFRLLPGHRYGLALNVSGDDLTLRVWGDDGLDETRTVRHPEVRHLPLAAWRVGDWWAENRSFNGEIAWRSLGGPVSAEALEKLAHP